MKKLRVKSELLTGYMEFLINSIGSDKISIISPSNIKERGCQLSLRVNKGKEIFNKLTENGVISDWREPDVIRIAPVPLYNSFEDVFNFYKIINELV